MTNTRYGRKVRIKTCPTKTCRNYKKGMQDIGSRDYENHYCTFCGCHYDGKVGGKLKFWTKKEWDEAVEKAWKEN